MEKQLRRSKQDAVLGGVAGGFAKYFGIDVVIVRLLMVVSLFVSFGISLFAYLILWVVLPEEPHYHFGEQAATRQDTEPAHANHDSDRNIKIVAIALIGFGTYMLLDQYIAWYHLGKFFWPMALIGLGAFLLLRKRDQEIAANGDTPGHTEPGQKPATPDQTSGGNIAHDQPGDETDESFKVN